MVSGSRIPLVMRDFKLPPDWLYRGEGNCNVVISLPKLRKILRVRKTNKRKSLFSWLITWITSIFYWYCGKAVSEESRDVKFYRKIMRPLLGTSCVCDVEQVFLSKQATKELEEKLESDRPDFRKNKGLQYGRAALFDDYAFLPDNYYPFSLANDTFAIEIKPKQGWMPFSENQCIFCMNQYLKRAKGQIRQLSSYCPLDLFSGDPAKMVRAVMALVANPQNNFRMFKNGKLCYGENHSYGDFMQLVTDFFMNNQTSFDNLMVQFCFLVQQCLLTNFDSGTKSRLCDQKLFCEWNNIIQKNSIRNQLPEGCVLEKILAVQMLDVEGHQYYAKLLGDRALPDFNYVNGLLEEMAEIGETCLKCAIMMLSDSKSDLVFAPYLISAIAKDCSLILTFRKIVDSSSDNLGLKNVMCTKYGNFVVNVGVFDLYPKPLSTIEKHRNNIRKSVELYMENNAK